jgi:hypothetical protein
MVISWGGVKVVLYVCLHRRCCHLSSTFFTAIDGKYLVIALQVIQIAALRTIYIKVEHLHSTPPAVTNYAWLTNYHNLLDSLLTTSIITLFARDALPSE